MSDATGNSSSMYDGEVIATDEIFGPLDAQHRWFLARRAGAARHGL